MDGEEAELTATRIGGRGRGGLVGWWVDREGSGKREREREGELGKAVSGW